MSAITIIISIIQHLISKFLFFLNWVLQNNEQVYIINCDYSNFTSCIALNSRDCIFEKVSIIETVDIFYDEIFNIINQYFSKKYWFTPEHPIWISSTLKQFIFSKKISHKIYKRASTVQTYNWFFNLRAQCKVQGKMYLKKQKIIEYFIQIFFRSLLLKSVLIYLDFH